MQSERKRITLYLSGGNFDANQAMTILAPALGQHFGGASMQPHVGVWSKDADAFKDAYEPGQLEPGLKLVVTVMPELLDNALTTLTNLLQTYNDKQGWGLSWIHTEVEVVDSAHFQLDA